MVARSRAACTDRCLRQGGLRTNPDLYWRLNDTSGTTALDSSPNAIDGTYSGGVTRATRAPSLGPRGPPSPSTARPAARVSGAFFNPTVYSESAWFKTTTTRGGKLIGFGDQASGSSGNYDRHVYMVNYGQLVFGAYTNQMNTPRRGQLQRRPVAPGRRDPRRSGMNLYVDGQPVARNPQTQAQSYTGYWRVGGDTSWEGDSSYFGGTIDEVAVYATTELTPFQVLSLYKASPAATVVNGPPVAVIATPSCTDLVCSFDGSGSTDPEAGVLTYAWDFGDGGSSTVARPSHTFASQGSKTVTLTVTDDRSATSTATVTVDVTAPPVNAPPVAVIATPSCTGLVCSFDGSGSTDPEGGVLTYAWDFGDGGSSTVARAVAHVRVAGQQDGDPDGDRRPVGHEHGDRHGRRHGAAGAHAAGRGDRDAVVHGPRVLVRRVGVHRSRGRRADVRVGLR